MNAANLPLTAAMAPLAKQHGVDLAPLATAEMEFDRKLREARQWLESTRQPADLVGEGIR